MNLFKAKWSRWKFEDCRASFTRFLTIEKLLPFLPPHPPPPLKPYNCSKRSSWIYSKSVRYHPYLNDLVLCWSMRKEKIPSAIDVLTGKECCQLGIDGELPIEAPVTAGCVPPAEIVAVIRPESVIRSSSPNSLNQKYIFKDELEMSKRIRHIHESKDYQNGEYVHAERVKPSSRNGLHGLYTFSLQQKYPKLFCKAGVYTFLFSVVSSFSGLLRYESFRLVGYDVNRYTEF